MTFRVTVDQDTCQGYACCLMTAPEIFDLDETGKAVVLQAEPDAARRGVAEQAARGCPARAIVVTDG